MLSFTLEFGKFGYNNSAWDLMTEQVLRANLLSHRIMDSHHCVTLHPDVFSSHMPRVFIMLRVSMILMKQI